MVLDSDVSCFTLEGSRYLVDFGRKAAGHNEVHEFPVNEIDRHAKRSRHGFQSHTLVGIQKLHSKTKSLKMVQTLNTIAHLDLCHRVTCTA